MGKITVKSFLNKKLKPIKVYDDIEELGYSLYYSITYNRKTQYIRSFTGAIMTEKAFNYLQETNKPLYYETNYSSNVSMVKLENELEYIKKAVSFIVNDNQKNDIYDSDFIIQLKDYFKDLRESLLFIGWLNYNIHINEEHKNEKETENMFKEFKDPYYEIEQFYYSFNKEKTLIHNISQLEKVLNIDLKKYFFPEILKLWYVIDLIIKSYKHHSIKVDFIVNYDENKYIETNKKLKYPVTNQEIKDISKILKFKALII
jgi:hypothetical protein